MMPAGNKPGTNNGGGRRPRPTAERHNILIERELWAWLVQNGKPSAVIEKLIREKMTPA